MKPVSVLFATAVLCMACGKMSFQNATQAQEKLANENSLRENLSQAQEASAQSCGGPAELRDPLKVTDADSKSDTDILTEIVQNLEFNIDSARELIDALEQTQGCEVELAMNRQLIKLTLNLLEKIQQDAQFRRQMIEIARRHLAAHPGI